MPSLPALGGVRNPSTASSASTLPVLVTVTWYPTAWGTSFRRGKCVPVVLYVSRSSARRGVSERLAGDALILYVNVVYERPNPKGITASPV
jgi:hypothetical protein